MNITNLLNNWTSYGNLNLYLSEIEELKGSCSNVAILIDNTEASADLILAATSLLQFTVFIPAYFPTSTVNDLLSEYKIDTLIKPNVGGLDIKKLQEIKEQSNHNNTENLVGILTSGTTGKSKCTIRSWSNLLQEVKISDKIKNKKWFLGYPLAHFAGIQVFLHSVLNQGKLVLADLSSSEIYKKVLLEEAVDIICCTPSFFRQLTRVISVSDLKTISHLTLGGEYIDPQLLSFIAENFPNVKVTQIYASSELGEVFRVNDKKEGFDIKLVDGEKIKIENDELFVKRSAKSAIGYLDKNFVDEWISTGDKVRTEGDRVLFNGRLDDIINIGGNKVSLIEIENVLRDHCNVDDLMVTSCNNPFSGNVVRVTIVPKNAENEDKMRSDLFSFCQKRLPEYKIPSWIVFENDLTNKFNYKKIRKVNNV